MSSVPVLRRLRDTMSTAAKEATIPQTQIKNHSKNFAYQTVTTGCQSQIKPTMCSG